MALKTIIHNTIQGISIRKKNIEVILISTSIASKERKKGKLLPNKLCVLNNPNARLGDSTKYALRVIEIQTLQVVQKDAFGSGHMLNVTSPAILVVREQTHETKARNELYIFCNIRRGFFFLDPYGEGAISTKTKRESQPLSRFRN